MTFKDILAGLRDFISMYEGEALAIGGVAAYQYALTRLGSAAAESSHDVDLSISLHAYADLRDRYEVVSNVRLGKHQIVHEGVEYDLYVEHNNSLRVPYEELMGASRVLNGIPCACPEHLLVLKLDACKDRRGSSKGEKDERDLVRIVLALDEKPDMDIICRYLNESDLKVLESLARRPELFEALTEGNMHAASKLRAQYSSRLDAIANELPSCHRSSTPRP